MNSPARPTSANETSGFASPPVVTSEVADPDRPDAEQRKKHAKAAGRCQPDAGGKRNRPVRHPKLIPWASGSSVLQLIVLVWRRM